MNETTLESPTTSKPAWTGEWARGGWEGDDPLLRNKRQQWWNSPDHRKVRGAKDTQALEKLLAAGDWAEDGASLMALRAAAYRIGEGRADYARILCQVVEQGRAPLEKLDLWAEQWMLGKWVGGIIERLDQPDYKNLFGMLVQRWPWTLVQAGRAATGQQTWRHPVISLMRQGHKDLAMETTSAIPPTDWMDMGGDYYQNRRWWREQTCWFKDDPSWIFHLMKVAPKLLEIDQNSGMGPLEQAAYDWRPVMLKYLLEAGFQPQRELSFGLDLPHWAAFSVSETRWCSRSSTAIDKTDAEMTQDLARFGECLRSMKSMGLDIGGKVLEADMRGIKRKRNLPKPKQDIRSYLRKRKFVREQTKTDIETVLMEAFTDQVVEPRKSKTLRL